MEEDVTRASLLSRVRDASDQAAWAEFETRYRELILRYALSRGLQHADAEDVRQIVMMSMAAAMRRFDYSPERGRFRNYLGRAVRNAVARLQARPNRGGTELDSYVESSLSAEADGGDPVWEQEWMDHHYRLALRTLRQTFDARSIEVFDRLLNGKTVAETAIDYDLSQQAVHKIKQRIRGRMRQLIAAQIREEDEPDELPAK